MNNLSFPKSFGDKDDGERRITWIPVEKRLPKKEGHYLFTGTRRNEKKLIVGETYFNGINFSEFSFDGFTIIIAWAELPTPYRNES